MRFFQKYKRKSNEVYFDIEELPVWNWMKVHETGFLGYLLKKPKKESRPELKNIWNSLYNQYIKEFGVSERYIKELRIRKKIALLQCDLIITGDKSIKSFIGAEENYLEEMRKDKRSSFEQTIIGIEKVMGFNLNPKNISVKRYYTYIKELRGKN